MRSILTSFFFFQAEDGIRDYKVTGVQTCALPILARVAREWELARSSFYHQRTLAGQLRIFQRRGPKTAWTDAALTEKIRAVLAASPFYGEGHRKAWARLRMAGGRTSKARVLRLMREAQLLAPTPAIQGAENPHTGTIITEH